MVDIQFDRYYRYAEMTDLIKEYLEDYPRFIALDSSGKSYEGRDIWVVTVTNTATGQANEKPALWIDGNIHATEVSPSTACLYLINKLVTQYGIDDEVTRVLDTRTFYICPRVNPDGAELALADKPRNIRSSTRPYPYDEEPLPQGWREEDVDGDGRILAMRIPDPNGTWKAHPDEPRLMIRRDPIEVEGTYYRLMPEGRIDDYDGFTIQYQGIKENLDLNRNFPAQWRQEGEQRGAGPYPTSEPEARAIVDFIMRHSNICGAVTYHTFSGVILRPYGTKPDDDFIPEDLWTFQKIGKAGSDITGYPVASVFHEFKYHPKEVITGVFDDWLFDHYGIYSWTVELWSPQNKAGIKEYKYIDWYREHELEDDFKLLKWSDEVLDGKGHIDWYEYDHPELGKVELGGWDFMYCWRNPPPQFLEKEVAPFADWMIWHNLISPKLELVNASATDLGNGNYQIQAVVENSGWLPTYVAKQALKKSVIRGVIAEIKLASDMSLKTGKLREELPQLEGRNETPVSATPWSYGANTPQRTKVEWVVHAPNGGEVKLTLRHDRAGTIRHTMNLS